MRFVLSALFSILFTANALADCSVPADRYMSVNISEISSPVFDYEGNELKGCLVHADEDILGYATESQLCNAKSGSESKIRLSYGCCDTGRNSGEAACLVRAKNWFGIESAHGNGVSVYIDNNVKDK